MVGWLEDSVSCFEKIEIYIFLNANIRNSYGYIKFLYIYSSYFGEKNKYWLQKVGNKNKI